MLSYDWDWNKNRSKRQCWENERRTNFRSLNLKFSDPGKLFALLSSLWDERCPPIEVKINRYLMNITGADLNFVLHTPVCDGDPQIHVLGDVELKNTIYLSAESDFVIRLLYKSRGPVYTDNVADVDPKLLRYLSEHLKKTEKSRFESILVVPVFLSSFGRPTFFYCVVNSSVRIGGLDRNKTLIDECLRYCKVLVASTYCSDQEKLHSAMCTNVIRGAMLAFTCVDSDTELAESIQSQSIRITGAESAKAYFFRQIGGHGLAQMIDFVNTSNEMKPIAVERILKSSVSTPEVVQNKNVKDAFLFTKILNEDYKPTAKTLLSFPTFCNGSTNGHVEVFDKKVGIFSPIDEETARGLGAVYGLAVEVMWTFRDLKKSKQLREIVDCLLMRRCEILCDNLSPYLYCSHLHSYDYLLEYRFKPSDVEEMHTICILMGIFDELDCLKRIRLDESSLLRFLISVKAAYGPCPYHNWYRAFGAAHFIFILHNSLSLLKNGVLTDIEGFALLIAAISYGVDFRGTTTPFQVVAGNSLAALYSTAGGTQEKLSLAMTIQMITHPNCNLLSSMSLDDFKTFVNILQILIIDSNMDVHVDQVPKIFDMANEKYDRTKTENIRLLLSLCMTCASLSDYTRPWPYISNIHDRQMSEFCRLPDPCKAGDVFDLDEFKFSSAIQVELQVAFIKCIVLPAFENLYVIFPTTYECYSRAEHNLAIIEELMDSLAQHPGSSLYDLYKNK